VFVADQLFATLDTRTRKWHVPGWGDVLLSDTVGFVRDLPHHLVASFRSTLEEARHADLLLHVVDASHPEAQQQIDTVDRVLEQIGVEAPHRLLVLNKVDRVADRSWIDVLRVRYGDSVSVSAATGEGIDRLTSVVSERLGDGIVDAEIATHAGNGRVISWLNDNADIRDRSYADSNVVYRCRIPSRFVPALQEQDCDIQVFSTTSPIPAAGNGDGENVSRG
jgi:GTP-binding protein HflX